MGREKTQRNLSYKPLCKHFVPKCKNTKTKTTLLGEEIEALYLMDILNLYQEEASKKMNVSRPTFARILKSARQKLTLALVSGGEIILQDLKDDVIVAVCTDENGSFKDTKVTDKYIQYYKLTKTNITKIKRVLNPLFNSSQKPPHILPKIFSKEEVNIFICSKVGEGLKNSLIFKGIGVMIKDDFTLEDLAKIILHVKEKDGKR